MSHNTLDFPARVERLHAYIAEGRVIRGGSWSEDGGERACLLTAMYPEVDGYLSIRPCPADALPLWFRVLVLNMNDLGTEAAWPEMIQRFGTLMQRVHVLTEDGWRRLDYAARRIALDVALPHAGEARDVVQSIRDMCSRAERGDAVPPEDWAAARAVVRVPARAAAKAAAKAAARAAAWAAARTAEDWAAEDWAASWTADHRASAWIADSAAAWAAASNGARAAAQAAAWDRITSELLAAIEAACTAAEASRDA